jgi:two-component system OmpR family response regulator
MRVLVIEDEADLRRALEQALREDGYAVDSAEDGETGLFKAKAWEYDALVLDIMLPEMDALDSVSDRVRGLDLGADDYVVKPFEISELLARLRALIRRAAGNADSRIKIGDTLIDTASRTVKQAGEPVKLTAREYALVELLALHCGKLITRTQIYEHIFDENDDTLSNLVDVHISNIRKKLGKDFITTRRGQGYLIDD